MSTEKLIAYLKSHPHLDDGTVAKNLWRHKLGKAAVAAARASIGGKPLAVPAGNRPSGPLFPAASPATVVGRPVAELLAKYDEPRKIAAAVKKLGSRSYVADDELRRDLGISPDRWRAAVAHPSVQQFRYVLPDKKVVWMQPAAQQELADTIAMRGD